MRKYELIVIGSGAGIDLVANAFGHGMEVPVVDRGCLGGTCLNRGCIPSKVMICPAVVIRMAEEARAIGIYAKIEKVESGPRPDAGADRGCRANGHRLA